ncbi:hypothetical protein D9M68_903780 [compost metagenome]
MIDGLQTDEAVPNVGCPEHLVGCRLGGDWCCLVDAIHDGLTSIFNTHQRPSCVEYVCQGAREQLAGVLQVLLGVGLGDGDALEGFVEDGDDALLFFEVRC